MQNANLELYTAEMGQIAAERRVLFVDLFHISQRIMKLVDWDNSPLRNLDGQKRDRFGSASPYGTPDEKTAFVPLTVNGIHITENGSRTLAITFDGTLFGNTDPRPEGDKVEALRKAVLAKNQHLAQRLPRHRWVQRFWRSLQSEIR